ncbi:MAG TPA: (E)-4-hydroxy-3-methylbut-2-enyl-diphosphate synthase [bacterium]|nr:(E)-4-hydroxy-3-methylbut-2-enyl-diphosphate synthase [bacterium]
MDNALPFFETPLAYRRRPTRVVAVGDVGVGGSEPIRVQSMLTCNTWDVERVLPELRGLVEAGCEIVRLTVPTRRDLEALPEIRRRMAAEGLRVPLVADIHFNPRLALGAAAHVEKVRINPGNYVDQKRFATREYTDAEYADELARVEEALLPLIAELRKHGRSLRIGVNHGSLSDRVMNRYGDTPLGMVECAMEYLRILARHGYHDTIVSMKSSNPLVVIQAYRLLTLAMDREGMDYPLHLGVTEAGDGPDGRLKSAIGIGALLCDGLGDTVRVSLTEPAANEIPAARELVAAVNAIRQGTAWPEAVFRAPIDFARRPTRRVPLGTERALGDVGGDVRVAFLALRPEGYVLRMGADAAESPFDAELLPPMVNGGADGDPLRLVTPEQALAADNAGTRAPLIVLDAADVDGPRLAPLLGEGRALSRGALLLVRGPHPLYAVRRLVQRLDAEGLDWPVGVLVPEDARGMPPLGVAAEIGSLAADGLLDAIVAPGNDPAAPITEYCKTLLQAARLRTYKTEYISCPSCGRTLFDLEETTARIKTRTSHLKGVKIGIMGCIVNGPGEMADADFGYVGGAPGKVNLYKGQDCLVRGVPTAQAVERLIDLIKQHGAWVEP